MIDRVPRHPSRAAFVAGVLAGLLLATLPLTVPNGLSKAEAIPGPGFTSLAAYQQVQGKVNATLGGPWGLISMEGVVSPEPVAPFAWGQDRCQVLPGPTLWNLSGIANVSTSLWSGRAVFWQLVYLNSSGAMLFGSDVNGTVVIDGPYLASTPCVTILESGSGGIYGSFGPSYWLPNGTFVRELLRTLEQLDSASWGATAANHLGNVSFTAWADRGVAYYTLGYTWLNLVGWTEGAWLVWYQGCGVPGRSGPQPYQTTGWALNSSPTTYYGSIGSGSGGLSCPVSNAEFHVGFSETGSNSTGLGAYLGFRLSVGLGSNGSYIYFDTANSLVSWMTGVSLGTAGGVPVAPAQEQCPSNATRVTSCVAPRTSWYAVLESPVGWILDTFPSTAGGSEWSRPNVFVTNNDTLVVVSSTNLTGTGDELSLVPLYSFPQVTGSTVT